MRSLPDLLNKLCLDAPMVGVFWFIIFCKSYPCEQASTNAYLLFSAIWLIYVVDRMIEKELSRTRERHRFIKKNITPVLIMGVAILLFSIVLLTKTQLTSAFLYQTFTITFIAIIYLLLARVLRPNRANEWIKNIFCSVIFSIAVSYPAWSNIRQWSDSKYIVIEICLLILLILTNLRFIENTESSQKRVQPTIMLLSLLLLTGSILHASKISLTWGISLALMHVIKWLRLDEKSPAYFDIALILASMIMIVV